jgi:hypothetical protein
MVETRQVPRAEVGYSGLKRWGGRVTEEFLPELQGVRGIRQYNEMRNNDPVIGAVLKATRDTARSIAWNFEPADESPEAMAWAEFGNQCLGDMSHSMSDLVSEILTMLPFGFAPLCDVYKVRAGPDADPDSGYADGKVGFRKFALRKQETVDEWIFDPNGGIQGFWQLAGLSYQRTQIPIDRIVLFRTEHEANNPEGYSLLRPAYRPWYHKKNLEEIEAIGIERDLTGVLHLDLPRGATLQDRSDALDILERVKMDEQTGILTQKGDTDRDDWGVELLTAPGSKSIDVGKTIERYAGEIATVFLAQFLRLGQSSSTTGGSYALSRSHKDLFSLSIATLADNIEETMNRFPVRRLMRLNGVPRNLWPVLKHGRIADREIDIFSASLKNLADAGLLGPIDSPLVNWIRGELEAPELPEDDSANPQPETEPGGLSWYPLRERDLRGWVMR